MQFIRSDALLREARREGIVGRDERAAAAEWVRAYDEALDGRIDGGFFDFQIDGYLKMTIDNPFSLRTEKTEGLNRLLNRMFLEGEPRDALPLQLGSRAQVLPSAPQKPDPSAWEVALMVLMALNPLTYVGCSSGEPLDCSGCPKGLCYEGEKTIYPDAATSGGDDADVDAALSSDAEAPQTVTGIICGCPPKTHEATCLPDEPGGRNYPCCISDSTNDDKH